MKKNFIYNLIYQVFTILMPLITAPYLSRIIGAEGLGMYSYTFTVAEYFVYFALLGVANYGNRAIASAKKDEKSKTFINIYSVQLCTSLIVLIGYLIFAVFLNNKYNLLTYIQIFYVMSAALDVTWYFFGMEKFKLTTIRNVVIKTTSLVLIFICIRDGEDVYKYSLIMSLSYFLSQAIMWRYIIKEISFEKPDLNEMKKNFKNMVILFIPVIAITLYKMMDKIMLEILGSIEFVGFYECAEKIVRVPALVITALGTSMLPRMAKLGASGENEKILKYFGLSIEFSGFFTFAMASIIFSIAEYLIPLYYGKGFEYSIILLQILCFTLYFTSWANAIRTQYLLPLNHDKEYIISVFLGAIVNLIINFILIPKYGAIGAAIATVVAEATVAIVQTIAIRKELPLKQEIKKYFVFLIPAIITCILNYLLINNLEISIVSIILMMIISGMVYCLISVLILRLVKSELLNNVCEFIKNINVRKKVHNN